MGRITFGVKVAPMHVTYDELLRVWRDADQAPELEHAWVFDHFYPIAGNEEGPCLEGWTVLTALATQTQRLRVGSMVMGNTYRHPAVLANMAATLDIIANGRLEFGLGAGWHEAEHAAYGIPFGTAAERINRMDETCQVCIKLWTEHRANFAGKYYQLTNALCEPKPVQKPHPPIVIGGSGEKLTLRTVARYADIWNCNSSGLDQFKHKSQVLDEHCAREGRDPAAITRSIQMFANVEAPEQAREDVKGYLEAGVTHVIFYLRPPLAKNAVARVVRDIVRPLRDELGI